MSNPKNKKKIAISIGFISFLALLSTFAIFALSWAYIRKKREEDNTYEKMLRLQMEQKKRISKEQMEYNHRKILELEEELNEARRKSDDFIIQKLRLSTEKLAAENEQIKAISNSHKLIEQQWKQSELYKRIIQKAGTPDFVLSDEEWKDIGQNIDVVYDNFTYRLQELTKLSDIERQLCYLIKMEVRPAAIAEMLRRQKGSITMARKRLGKKILRKDCTAEDFDAFILNF